MPPSAIVWRRGRHALGVRCLANVAVRQVVHANCPDPRSDLLAQKPPLRAPPPQCGGCDAQLLCHLACGPVSSLTQLGRPDLRMPIRPYSPAQPVAYGHGPRDTFRRWNRAWFRICEAWASVCVSGALSRAATVTEHSVAPPSATHSDSPARLAHADSQREPIGSLGRPGP